MTEEQIAKQIALIEILTHILNLLGNTMDDKQFVRSEAVLKRIASKIQEL